MSEVKASVLVVEDENTVAKYIQKSLKRLGYAVAAVASSGEDAIQRASETDPDLVLMDIGLRGDMDGVEAAQEIWHRLQVPVVYVSCYADGDTFQRAKLAEPFGYIVKPFEERDLHAAIEMALYQREREIVHDAAEGKQAEEKLEEERKYRKIFDYSNEMFFLIDPAKNKILDVNPRASWTLGYSREELMSVPVSAIHLDDIPKLLRLAQSVSKHGYGWAELSYVTKSGQLLSTEITGWAFDVGGRPCIIVMACDITERKRTEQDLRESNRRLEQRVQNLISVNALIQ